MPLDMEGHSGLDLGARAAALQALLDAAPDAWVAAIDDRGFFVSVPPGLDLGTHEVLPARSALDLAAPGDGTAVVEGWNRAHAAGASRVELRVGESESEGVLHFFDLRPVHGVFVGVLVSDGRHELRQMREEVSFRPRVCTQRKDEVAVWIDVDEDTTRMLGWTRAELVGRGGLELTHPDDQDRAIEAWMEMLARPGTQQRVRIRYRTASGEWLWVETMHRNLLDDPEHRCVLAECLDVSDEMAAHEAVRAREQLFQRIAETVPLGLVQLDGDGSVVYANERTSAVIGCSGSSMEELFALVSASCRASLEAAARDLLADGVDRDLEIVTRSRRRDDKGHCHVRLRALTDDRGEVNGAILCFEDITERVRARVELERRATHDALTSCLNRGSIMSTLAAVVESEHDVGIAFIDLDGFKEVNDRCGHPVGDAVLVEVARRLRACARSEDRVGRLGGDEFLVVCPGIGQRRDLARLMHRVAEAVRVPIPVPGRSLQVDTSIGLAVGPEDGTDPEVLLAAADTAMYAAKRAS